MLWAALLLGFFGFMHSGEFTVPNNSAFDPQCHLTARDIAVDCHQNPTMIRVLLKQSKTDPFHLHVHIFVGHSGNDLCPVSAILAYLAVRGIDDGPLYEFANGCPLSP